MAKVQIAQAPGAGHPSWLLPGNNYLLISPILVFLKFLDGLGRSPHAIRATAYPLKLFRSSRAVRSLPGQISLLLSPKCRRYRSTVPATVTFNGMYH